MVDLNDFKKERECLYKDERFSVRDNGAVLRHSRENKPQRKYDNQWTFGTPNCNGHLLLASEFVHRIVAYAFIGEPPTTQHIVDHKNTNRQNNRPENLRWLTKLENILNNPITVKRITFRCGSIEAFLNDPSLLKNYVNEDPNFTWMRAVTPEEAKISWERLNNWAKKEIDKSASKVSSLGDWIFSTKDEVEEIPEITTSITRNALQKNWKTPVEFLCCPQDTSTNQIAAYVANLKAEKIFSHNQYSNSIVEDFAISKDGATLWVMCRNSDNSATKPYSLAEVTYENNFFMHNNLGSYFKKDGGEKQFPLAQGLEWTGGETFDESCG